MIVCINVIFMFVHLCYDHYIYTQVLYYNTGVVHI